MDLIRPGLQRGKTFRQRPIAGLAHDCVNVDSPEGRRYVTPDGRSYPSVTTVLGRVLDHAWLDDWRERVGEQEAARVSRRAGDRGTKIHSACERYLLNRDDFSVGLMPDDLVLFGAIKRVLDSRVDDVVGLETPLYLDAHRIGGRLDLIADFDGQFSLIDFKTSRRRRTEEDVLGYFLQTGEYVSMLGARLVELGAFRPIRTVILMAVDGGDCQVFDLNVRSTMRYARLAAEVFGNRPLD